MKSSSHFQKLQTCSFVQRIASYEMMCKMIKIYLKLSKNHYWNKGAQRALGRSPEEKVKGNSGANYSEPQGNNLNNFGRGPFDDVIY